MNATPVSVVEMPSFLRAAEAIWNEEERIELIDYVAYFPESGVIVPGTGGVRKLRWGRSGSGKRGGARIVYFFHNVDHPLYMLLAYAKSDAPDLSSSEKKDATAIALALREAFRSGRVR